MIEITILTYLKSVLDKPVYYGAKPDKEPEEYVFFEKTSSGENDMLPNSTYAFQSYSDTFYKSMVLNEKVKSAVKSLINLSEISKVSFNSDYPFNDMTKKQYRHQAVFDIYHY